MRQTAPRTEHSQSSILISGCIISAVSAAFFLLLPISIGAVASEGTVNESGLGLLATAYMIAFTIACVIGALAPPSFNQKLASVFGFVVLSIGFGMATLYLDTPNLLAFSFAIAGIGAGILYSIGFRIIGMAKNISSAFGYKLFAEQIVGASLFFYLSQAGISFVFMMGFLAVFVLISTLVVTIMPSRSILAKDTSNGDRKFPSGVLIWSILAIVFYMFAMTGSWAFLETLSQSKDVKPEQFSILGAISLLLGAVGGFAAGLQGEKMGLKTPLLISAMATLAIFVILMASGYFGFVIFTLSFPLIWNYALAYQLAAAAKNDPANRFSGWLAPAIALGASGGPIIAGLILENTQGYSAMLILSGLGSALALLLSMRKTPLQS